jgi:heme-degrading monooxygenase HmoA
MFVAVYRWRLKPGMEEQFRQGWRQITQLAREGHGSHGSCLFKAADGTWVGIARWPDREARAAFFAQGSRAPEASALMREATLERLEDMELEEVDNLWAPFPVEGEAR